MPTFQKQPLFVYDEPITYNDLSGGINQGPSNEKIHDNQVRDAVNFHYMNRTLVKRLGGEVVKNFVFPDISLTLGKGFIQGVFLFVVAGEEYIIVIRDGFLYTGPFLEEEVQMDPLYISIDSKFFTTAYRLSPLNFTIGLPLIESGQVDYYEDHGGFIEHKTTESQTYYLVCQNFRPVEAVVHEDSLYIATGTRLLVVRPVNGALVAQVVDPYVVNSWEYLRVGFNFLSPFPELCVRNTDNVGALRVNNIICPTHTIFKGDDTTTFKVVADYEQGLRKFDYYFKWQWRKEEDEEWETEEFKESKDSFSVNPSSFDVGDIILVRCTVTRPFFLDKEEEGDPYEVDVARTTPAQTTVSFTVSAGTSAEYSPAPSAEYLDIHSCNRILSDGNKYILYGGVYTPSEWHKCVINNYSYISSPGNLDFQTHKGERIVSVAPLDGSLVVFAYNRNIGGTTHLVTGNGDDVELDQFYSPYKRKLIHGSIACDHPYTVQPIPNALVFKEGTNIWMLAARELAFDKVDFTLVNHQLNNVESALKFPNKAWTPGEEITLFSYVTPEYYALIDIDKETQWKMYFNQVVSYQEENEQTYPWLRDISPIFACNNVSVLKGIPTLFPKQKFEMVQLTGKDYSDLGKPFSCLLALKSYNMTYDNKVKLLDSVRIKLNRGYSGNLRHHLQVYNEEGYLILGERKSAFVDENTGDLVYATKSNYYDKDLDVMDLPALHVEEGSLNEAQLERGILTSRRYQANKRFPFLSASVIIEVSGAESYAFGSITFYYQNTNIPVKTLHKLYREIIREEDLE